MENLLQRSRYELKYIISEATAHEVRSFARNHLMPDPFARPERNYSYNIYSVYLDSPGLDLMNQTLEGLKNRFKLRVRFYDNNPDHLVFFEVKRRENDAIIKVRAKVRRDRAHNLMYAHNAWPDRTDLTNPADDRSWNALRKFCELRDKMNARPRALVAYNREAWCAPEDDSVRVTFDRELEAAPYDPEKTFKLERTDEWLKPQMRGVVLELKFTDRFPNWMRQMVQTFSLYRTSMAKYVTCSVALTADSSALIRQCEDARKILAARRWEEQRRLERERSIRDNGAGKLEPTLPAPPGAPVAASVVGPAGAWGTGEGKSAVRTILSGAPGGLIL